MSLDPFLKVIGCWIRVFSFFLKGSVLNLVKFWPTKTKKILFCPINFLFLDVLSLQLYSWILYPRVQRKLSHACSAWLKGGQVDLEASQSSSVTQSCPTLCDPMNHSMPGLPVHHQLLESTHTHVHWVGDAIQPSHPLSSPSPPALNLYQHQGLFK